MTNELKKERRRYGKLDNVMLRGVPLYSQPPKLSFLAILLYISLRDTLGFLTPRDHKILLYLKLRVL